MSNPPLTLLDLDFHHIGIAVPSIEISLRFYTRLGYTATPIVEDPSQNVRLSMCSKAGFPRIELIAPLSTAGPVSQIVQRYPSGSVYHVCYAVRDLEATLQYIRESDVRITCISPRKQATLFQGLYVSFYLIAGAGLVEILEVPSLVRGIPANESPTRFS